MCGYDFRHLAFVVFLCFSFMGNAAIFTPTTVANLINDINIANANNSDDVIDLQGHTFILNTINNVSDGNNGLPSILSDNGHSLLITRGTIERDPTDSNPLTGSFRFFRVETGAHLILTDLSLLRGLANNDDFTQFPGNGGGAILNKGTLRLQSCTLINNVSSSALVFGDAGGGAIYNFGGVISGIRKCFFLDNKSAQDFGGAIINNLDVTGTVAGLIEEISQSTFDSNSAHVDGGAIANVIGSIITTIKDSTFLDNTAGGGGAIYSANNAFIDTIINSTFYGNTAVDGSPLISGYGGAILIASSTINKIYNNTFSSNAALEQGGGIANFGGTINNLVSNIIAKNIAPIAPDLDLIAGSFPILNNASFNLIGTDQGHTVINGVNNNQVGTLASPLDPLIGSPSNNGGPTFTSALNPNSPAINAGANPNALFFDQRGFGYFRSIGQTDIGAFELQICP